MGQPVRISESLLRDARLMGEATQRSIASQIEFWARLGRALEMLLQGDQVLALCKAGKTQSLSACLQSVDSAEGRQRLEAHQNSLPCPRYEPVPDSAGLLIRIEADGTRTIGRFVQRKFQPVKAAKKWKPAGR